MAQVKADSIRTKAFGTVTNSYTAVGSPLTQNWRMFRIANNTDGDLLFSLDGTTDNFFVPAGGFVLYDMAANALNVLDADWLVLKIGTQFYVKYVNAPTMNSIYIEGIYSEGV